MSYYSEAELLEIGFKHVGKNVKVSTCVKIYDAEKIEIGDNSRIDDFCLISGKVEIGRHCHITPMCLVAGGTEGVYISDFCTLAYGVKVFSQSDDYTGATMTNSTIPKKYKDEFCAPVHIKEYSIVGASAVIFPGVTVGEGCAVGAMSLVMSSIEPWGIYVGTPARRLKSRSRKLIEYANIFISQSSLM